MKFRFNKPPKKDAYLEGIMSRGNEAPAVKLRTQASATTKAKPKKRADELGEKYASVSETAKSVGREKADVTETIKSFARTDGVRKGKQVTVTGDQWVVGFTECDVSPTLDLRKVQKKLPASILQLCYTKVIDPDKVAGLVGKTPGITKAVFLSLLTKPEPTHKVLVQPKKKDEGE